MDKSKSILQVVSTTGGTPITSADARDYLRIDVDTSDDELMNLILSAVDFVEKSVSGGVTLLKKTYDLTLDAFPKSSDTPIALPRPPLQSVTSIKYYDPDNTQQTWTSTEYSVGTPTEGPGIVYPAYNYDWPATIDRRDAVVIRYVAGFETVNAIPARMKQAIRYLVVHYFENRDAFVTGTISSEVDLTVRSLINSCGWGFCVT